VQKLPKQGQKRELSTFFKKSFYTVTSYNNYMKFFFTFLLMPMMAFSQRIEENKFDKFDSVWKVSTNLIYFNKSKKDIAFVASYYDLMQVKHKGVKPHYTGFFFFKSNSVTSIDENKSSVQVEFTNGKINSYQYKGSYDIISSDEMAGMYVGIPDEDGEYDDLFSEPIKSIRINTTDRQLDYEIKEKNSNLVIDCLKLVKDEVSKGMKK